MLIMMFGEFFLNDIYYDLMKFLFLNVFFASETCLF